MDTPPRVAGDDDVLLDIRDLTVEFRVPEGLARAVDGVSLQVRQSETVALVGESGCGKSVTSLSVMRLLAEPPARIAGGSIRLRHSDGGWRDLLTLDKQAMRRLRGNEVAMIFQEPMTSLNPVHTVGAQIAEGIQIHRGVGRAEAMEQAAEMLVRVGIPEPRRRLAAYPHEMSGGMRQRVTIAVALACNPSMLIADEPTTALDVTIQAQILELIRGLQRDMKMAVLFITHDLGVVAEIARRVVVMYAGQVVEEGSVSAVLKRPRHPYTRGLLASVPRPDRVKGRGHRLHAIPGMVPDPMRLPVGCRFHPRCRDARPGLCDVQTPVLEPSESGHWVRCLRWREIAAADRDAAAASQASVVASTGPALPAAPPAGEPAATGPAAPGAAASPITSGVAHG